MFEGNLKLDKAFFSVNKLSEAEKLSWLEDKITNLINVSEDNLEQQLTHLRAYANSQDGYTIGDAITRLNKRRAGIRKVKIPHIFDITEVKVSQMTKLKSDINVSPRHSEYDDRSTAKVSQLVIKNILEENKFDELMVQMHRYKYILGEGYLFITWDDNLGDMDSDYVKRKEEGYTSIKLPNGKKVSLERPIMTGDVKFEIEYPWNVLVEQKRSGKYKDAQYMFRIEYRDKDEIIFDFPEAEGKLGELSSNSISQAMISSYYNYSDNETPIFHFYHKKTKYLPKGKYIKMVPGLILEESDLPYEHGDFPCERLTDIDIPTHQTGVSRYVHCLPVQKRIDELSFSVDKNNWLFGHTKYLLPVGAAKVEQLGNSNQVIHYAGPVPPSILQVQPSPPALYDRIASLVNTLQILMGTQGISRGEIPPGITANSALQFLNQLESERASSEIQKHAHFVVSVCKKALSVAGQNYKEDDGRIERVVGKDNRFNIKNFKAANLSKPYDIKFENSDGFPETLAAKRQRIQDMMQQNPQMMTGPQWMHHFGMSDEEGAIDFVTEAIKAAESENEDLMAGNDVMAPSDEEDSITHYRIHYNLFQKRAFKEQSSNEIMEKAQKHFFDTEAILVEKANVNPTFAQQVAMLPMFPIYFHENYQVPQSKEQAEALVQGQTNRGEEVTTSIPGEIKNEIK